jgi:two-component system alkaline phosphatase synthesis response regulator PhoP
MAPAKTILVVDDEPRLVSLVETYLTQSGFKVQTASNGREALSIAEHSNPDLIILDIMMPEMDGYEFMRLYRADHATPIILLTARVDFDEKVLGLESGADDYMTKPFRPRELMARVKSVLRRTGEKEPPVKVIHAADITLDRSAHAVQVAERYVDLTPSEFDLLAALMSAPGRVFSRLDLLDLLQGVRFEGYERAIDPHYIETVYGVGYRFARQ